MDASSALLTSSPVPPLELLAIALAVGIALWLRPWRAVGPAGPPWPWIGAWAALPWLWSLDRLTGSEWALPWSGAALCVLLAGWPLMALALIPSLAIAVGLGLLDPVTALDRTVWLGLVPATLAMAGGALVRRCGPAHPACYVVGRGLLATWAARSISLACWPAALPTDVPIDGTARLVTILLVGFFEGALTASLLAALVSCRPGWLATWAERIWMPPPRTPRAPGQ